MEENILEIVEKSCRIYRDVIAVKYLSHREIVEKSYGDKIGRASCRERV